MEAEAYSPHPIKIYQESISTIFLAKNGRMSTRTCHLDIRYFFITDCVETKETV